MNIYGLQDLATAIAEREVVLRLSVDRGQWHVTVFDRENPDDKLVEEYGNGISMIEALRSSFYHWDKGERS